MSAPIPIPRATIRASHRAAAVTAAARASVGADVEAAAATLAVNVVIVGDAGVGKTALAFRFTHGVFPAALHETVGADFFAITIGRKQSEVPSSLSDAPLFLQACFWDTAGAERFAPLTHQHVRSANVAIVAFSIHDRSSYEHVSSWLTCIANNCHHDVEILVVACQVDRANEEVKVSRTERDALAAGEHAYAEVSAITGENVDAALMGCLWRYADHMALQQSISREVSARWLQHRESRASIAVTPARSLPGSLHHNSSTSETTPPSTAAAAITNCRGSLTVFPSRLPTGTPCSECDSDRRSTSEDEAAENADEDEEYDAQSDGGDGQSVHSRLPPHDVDDAVDLRSGPVPSSASECPTCTELVWTLFPCLVRHRRREVCGASGVASNCRCRCHRPAPSTPRRRLGAALTATDLTSSTIGTLRTVDIVVEDMALLPSAGLARGATASRRDVFQVAQERRNQRRMAALGIQ